MRRAGDVPSSSARTCCSYSLHLLPLVWLGTAFGGDGVGRAPSPRPIRRRSAALYGLGNKGMLLGMAVAGSGHVPSSASTTRRGVAMIAVMLAGMIVGMNAPFRFLSASPTR